MDKQKQIEEMEKDIANSGVFMVTDPNTIARVVIDLGYRKSLKNAVVLTGTKTEERLEDLLVEFDEMSFYPATLMPNAEECAREWKRKLIYAIGQLRKETATITEQGQADWLDGYKVGFRDGVVALRTQTVEKIDEICKELTEDKV